MAWGTAGKVGADAAGSMATVHRTVTCGADPGTWWGPLRASMTLITQSQRGVWLCLLFSLDDTEPITSAEGERPIGQGPNVSRTFLFRSVPRNGATALNTVCTPCWDQLHFFERTLHSQAQQIRMNVCRDVMVMLEHIAEQRPPPGQYSLPLLPSPPTMQPSNNTTPTSSGKYKGNRTHASTG